MKAGIIIEKCGDDCEGREIKIYTDVRKIKILRTSGDWKMAFRLIFVFCCDILYIKGRI